MRLSLLIAMFLSGACSTPPAEPPEPTGPAVMRVYFEDEATLRELAGRYAPWEVQRDGGWMLLELSAAEQRTLREEGLRMELDAPKTAQLQPAGPVTTATARSTAAAEAPSSAAGMMKEGEEQESDDAAEVASPGIPGFPCYSTVEEVYARAAALAAAHPERARWSPIGSSWQRAADPAQGYPLMVLQLGTDREEAPDLVVVSGLHAREYAPIQASLRFAEELLGADGVDPDVTWLLDERQIHLILSANPDGRKLAEQHRLWRKNRREVSCGEDDGVDLNRNFPFDWGCCGGSSEDACSQVFRGDEAGSEPEIQAITDYVARVFADQRPDDRTTPAAASAQGLFLDLHSYSELVLWPWGSTTEPAPNAAALATLGRKLAWLTGYYPEPMADLYPTDGTSIDHVYGTLGVAAYTLELGTQFFEPCDAFEDQIYPAISRSLRYAAAVADAPYRTPAGPDVHDLTLSAEVIGRRDSVTLTVVADDTRYSDRNGEESAQPVHTIALTVDALPGSPGAPAPVLLEPADGALDSAVEAATVTLQGRDLGRGPHTLYVRARDADLQWGPPAAVRVTVGRP